MLTFLKFGGSLITDKDVSETAQTDVIQRLASETAAALTLQPQQLVIGHGSGSFGHIVGKKYQTRTGVQSQQQWRGFAEVGLVASRLTNIVIETLHSAGVAAMRFSPSASVICENGVIQTMATDTIQQALRSNLVPLIHGDVAFDSQMGGTIVSTEEVFLHLVGKLSPQRILLVGDYDGVFDQNNQVIETISSENIDDIRSALGRSGSTDVTGGMVAKVETMMALCQANPRLQVHIFSGKEPGNVKHMLEDTEFSSGTVITA